MSAPAGQRLVKRVLGARDEALKPKPESLAREGGPATLACECDPITTSLYSQLTDEDVGTVETAVRADPELAAILDSASTPAHRRRVLLNLGIWLGVQSVSERTRLGYLEPPIEVHTMARGPLAAAGGLYEADLIVDALQSARVEPETISRGLDFGCSSGRVVRVLASVYETSKWLACDPNATAVAWAAENIPSVEFFVSSQRPPLPIGEGSLDLAYAISIWSHFSPSAATQWFQEMHRVVRQGGTLLITAHGLQSVAFHAANHVRPAEELAEVQRSLYRRGWWYAADFGSAGDAGIVDADWGTSYLSPEWMLNQLCPAWRVLEYASGRNQDNQDVYVLQRV